MWRCRQDVISFSFFKCFVFIETLKLFPSADPGLYGINIVTIG